MVKQKHIFLLIFIAYIIVACENNNKLKESKITASDTSVVKVKNVISIKIFFGDNPAYYSDTIIFSTQKENVKSYPEGIYRYFLVNKEIFDELVEFNKRLLFDSNSLTNSGFCIISEFSDGSIMFKEVSNEYAYNYFRNVYYIFQKHKINNLETKWKNVYLFLHMLNPIYDTEKPLPLNPFELDSFVYLRSLQDKLGVPFVLYDKNLCECR